MSESISKAIQSVFSHKKHIFFSLFCFLFFAAYLFPFDDLSDYITAQIAKATQNRVFVAFKDLGLNILPPGLSLADVSLDTAALPTLKASRLSLSPSIASFLAMKPGFVASARGIFDGDASLTYKTGKKINDQESMQQIEIVFSEASLKQLAKFADLPVALQGKAAANIEGEIDPSFKTQPNTEFNLDIKSLKIPAATVPTLLGPVNLPDISFKAVKLKGRLVNGELIIEDTQLGESTDSVNGRIKGKFTVSIVNIGGNIMPRFGAYQLKLDLNLNKQAASDFGLFLGLFDKFKTLTGTGSRYAFQLNGVNFNTPPTPSAYTQF